MRQSVSTLPGTNDSGPRFGLIADDLTGACDAGVQFSQRGFSSVVWLDPHAPLITPTDLVILTTDSRNDPPDLARSKVQRACQLLARERRELIYKKIDSTLRGNLGPEIEAAMQASKFPLAVIAPAYPPMGRTLVDGRLRVVGETSDNPVHLPTLLLQQGVEGVFHVSRAFLRQGAKPLAERMKKASAAGEKVIVVDAEFPEDLKAAAEAAATLESRVLMVGSAGLAAEVATILAAEYRERTAKVSEGGISEESGSVVLLLGSSHPVTASQTEYLVRHRPVARLDLRTNQIELARKTLSEKCHLLVALNVGRGHEQHLGELLTILRNFPIRGFILSGGDTAAQICRALEVTGIRLESEIVPGIPWGRFLGGQVDGLPVATKAGGFGAEDALVVMTDCLAVQKAI